MGGGRRVLGWLGTEGSARDRRGLVEGQHGHLSGRERQGLHGPLICFFGDAPVQSSLVAPLACACDRHTAGDGSFRISLGWEAAEQAAFFSLAVTAC